ncbi:MULTISPECIES: peptidyl-dipeptidase Dcp [Pantoea]|jgi:peptidyl-dipeptidase Dcp|uniref:Peptidyl-dipeptidase Dcp n=1 Tax=Pantoea eucrina TaxID=472693 RepID=A0ABS1Z159_9GAMM|nr:MULTISPECIES: peptidyl-dipeptidase Dcp [Pantoea]MBM0746137.1 peptidyl-dipeptidase Dcp [Pantoea eucrina]MCL9645797.1 peptidyl-dipeptidase Dcp [Pantoea eucrina]MDJ0024628.1 peptidyl-dipeptidase Dcp [Pantoea eucrina]OIX94162.1 dipeptidyl carboxypeptidase II [Pantoea sp. Ae16]UBB14643.1 peptidyl-dipeptidase Dcp [Pantoea eucrina]
MNRSANPFFSASTLPYQAPPFDQISEDDFLPALEAGIEEKRREVAAIIANPAPPDFANTFEALERSGLLLSRVWQVFSAMTAANTSPRLQEVEEIITPALAALHDEIYLNSALFARLEAVWQQRSTACPDAEAVRLTEVTRQAFQLAGASLSDDEKQRLRDINQELAGLSTRFGNRLLAATQSAAYTVSSPEALAGLDDAALEQARAAAAARGLDNQWLIPLQNTTQQPALSRLTIRATREALFEQALKRCERNDVNDTRPLVSRMAQLRAEQAALLGYSSYAAWNLQDQMAKTPEAALDFMRNIVPAACERAGREAAEIEQLMAEQQQRFDLRAWDWNFYAEQVRQAKYDFDEDAIRPWFALDSVLERGAFWAATQLYGIRFSRRHDLPVYHPDVCVYEIFDADETPLALFYTDFFARDNKSGGAWMGNFVDQSALLDQKPVIYNVCNYTKPQPGQPALLSWDDVITLFHEFGHALHGLFASQRYASLSGTATPRDFVEFPSQINEHWASHEAVFASYARHWETGEPMPAALREKMVQAATFNKGYDMTELLAAALLDLQWHSLSAHDKPQDVEHFERQALQAENIALSAVPPRYRSSYFRHIWGGGYAAGYYAYIWTQMLADDGYQAFTEQGGLTRENGQRFRDLVLSRGNSSDLQHVWLSWRGKAPAPEPMLRHRGLSAE